MATDDVATARAVSDGVRAARAASDVGPFTSASSDDGEMRRRATLGRRGWPRTGFGRRRSAAAAIANSGNTVISGRATRWAGEKMGAGPDHGYFFFHARGIRMPGRAVQYEVGIRFFRMPILPFYVLLGGGGVTRTNPIFYFFNLINSVFEDTIHLNEI